MNKNMYQSRFSVAPASATHNRSVMNIPYSHLTTANFGKLVPFYVNEVLPGDTFEVTTKMLARMSTPLYPVLGNAFIDYFYFFVPNRLVWSRWAEFMGENKLKAWVNDVEYTIPHAPLVAKKGGLLDHMGIPTYEESQDVALDVNVLPFRAYQLIWNEWFRNENVTDPVLVNTGDSVLSEEADTLDRLLSVSKYFDYFTSALPAPQKGDSVDIPLGDFAPLKILDHDVIDASSIPDHSPIMRLGIQSPIYEGGFLGYDGLAPSVPGSQGADIGFYSKYDHPMGGTGSGVGVSAFLNTVADLSSVSTVTVNALRQSFQMQRLLELQARSGTRYIEIIKASFGVLSPDARLQRPEYLGGTRIDVQMQQVAQTSSTDSQSPLGHVGAYSKTISGNRDFNTSFTEHGYVIGVMCARTAHIYQQGLHKMWSRRGRYDFYWPAFAHVSEQPILLKQIFATGTEQDDEVFGYQEAWAEYRYKPNEVTGAFRSTVDGNLDEWHYADYYESRPYLSAEWMEETSANVDRTLAVTSALHDQLIFDIRVDCKATRVMPLYSIPGLIDHM